MMSKSLFSILRADPTAYYLIANAVRAVLTSFHGEPPFGNPGGFLLELPCRPSSDMTIADIANLICPVQYPSEKYDNIILEHELETGTGIDHIQLKEATTIIQNALRTPRLLDALLHLEYSHSLVWGYMVGSYYESHYSRDRRAISRHELERNYLENRIKYDLAFLSAFRGIEAVLGNPFFKKHEITHLLLAVDQQFGTFFSTRPYRSWHEYFSSHKRRWTYASLIDHYLYLRNAVAAHGNTTPPTIVMDDQVLEIQYFLRHLIDEITCSQLAQNMKHDKHAYQFLRRERTAQDERRCQITKDHLKTNLQ